MTGPIAGRLRWRGALRHRNFRLFWFGQLISLIGTWMQSIAQAWLVVLLTHDPFWLGIVAAAQFLPVLLFGLFGGIVADVIPKRKALIGTQAAAMMLALTLALLTYTGAVALWHVLALALLLGVVNSVDMPVRQAFVVEMVGREDLTNAVGLNGAVFNGARIIGPAIGGLLIAWLGVSACFLLNGVSFLAVIAGLLAMRTGDLAPGMGLKRPRDAREVVASLMEGLRHVRSTPVIALAMVVMGLVSTVAMNFNVVGPALADHVLHVGSEGLGFLMASMGLGSFAAALTVAALRRPRPALIVGGAVGLGVVEMLLGLVTSYPVALVAMFGAGYFAIAMAISSNTSIQLAVPDHLRGRVMAVYATVFAGSTPIGAPLVGWAASTWSTELVLVLGGAMAAAIGLAGAGWLWRGGLDAPGAPRRTLAHRMRREPVVVAAMDEVEPGP
jgi:MFS family permease